MPHTNLFIQLNFLSLYSKFLKKHMTKSNSDFSTIQVWIYILLRLLALLQLQLFFPLKIKFTCKSCLYYSILLSSLVKKIRLNILCRLSPIRAINANVKTPHDINRYRWCYHNAALKKIKKCTIQVMWYYLELYSLSRLCIRTNSCSF